MAFSAPYHSSLNTSGSLPLAALIDVVFLVVIFFMVNASFAVDASRASVVGVDLPEAETADRPPVAAPIITIARDGTLVWERGGEQQAEVSVADIARLLRRDPPDSVIVRGDKLVPYGSLVAVMDAVRRAGVFRIALAIESVAQQAAR